MIIYIFVVRGIL